jgi:UDP-N-acetylglucosamine--N-acetylmuramyl-(pentapeptide) pyrophosphoryl-undecaprenol N-acetylglucosamine transferase
VLSGGGTGGHVYPNLSVVAALRKLLPGGEPLEMLYVGSESGAEGAIVERAGIEFKAISTAPIRGRMPWQMAANSGKIGLGVRQAREILGEFGPDAILLTGGYVSFPVAMAARSRGLPMTLYLPDLAPGWAVRAIARLAQRVAVTAIETLRQLPTSKTVVTGYPVREVFFQVDRAGGRERLRLNPEEKVLFVTGASSGAHSINQAVAAKLNGLLRLCEVVHLCGRADEPWLAGLRAGLPEDLRVRYHLYGYMHDEMPWAMAAADVALSRSGASVIGELPAVGLPAVLVPLPIAGGHQRLNAEYLARNKAAVVLEDDKLDGLLPVVGELLHDEERLREMRHASGRLARPNAATKIAGIVLEQAKAVPA